ncbi:MAG: hypothetical protein NXH80_04805 [Rhodobacteraceae bacterium]|nr:hypothetical protein [Paracoccaceae bacterium]
MQQATEVGLIKNELPEGIVAIGAPRAMREYAQSGVQLSRGDPYIVERDAREVAMD